MGCVNLFSFYFFVFLKKIQTLNLLIRNIIWIVGPMGTIIWAVDEINGWIAKGKLKIK